MHRHDNTFRSINVPNDSKPAQATAPSEPAFDGYNAATAAPRFPRCVRARTRSTGSYGRRRAG